MMKTEYAEKDGFLQRDNVEHEEYAEVYSTESREVDRKDSAGLLEKVLSRDNLNKAYNADDILLLVKSPLRLN